MRGKALLPVALLTFLFAVSAPVFADLSGTVWNVDAVVKTKIKIKGFGTDVSNDSSKETFTFSNGDGFAFSLMPTPGTWRAAGRKFYVELDPAWLQEGLKEALEDALWDEGIDAEVGAPVITTNLFSGKEGKGPAIKGKWKLAFAVSIIINSIDGIPVGSNFELTAKTTTNFTGVPFGLAENRSLESSGSNKTGSGAGNESLFEVIGIQVLQAVTGLAPLP